MNMRCPFCGSDNIAEAAARKKVDCTTFLQTISHVCLDCNNALGVKHPLIEQAQEGGTP